MTTIDTTVTVIPSGAPAPLRGVPRQARLFLGSVLATALAVAGLALAAPAHVTSADWRALALIVVGAAIAHYFVVHTPSNQVFHVGLAFTLAGAVLLPARLVVLLCITQHLSDWAKERYSWYIQAFNISNYLLAAMAAHEAASVVDGGVGADWHGVLAGVAACLAFVFVNHVLLARMLLLARGRTLDESGLATFDSLFSDLVLALFGLALAILWMLDPWALAIVFPPLFLIQRALTVPQLWAEARVDPKTGLFNARHFNLELVSELRRASRFQRPASVLMADLDLLREINNGHGHLAGDAVLRSVATVFKRELRDYDTAARFGGEEFAILLPETDRAGALRMAERIRAAVAAETISLAPREESLHATISIGVATFPSGGAAPEELLHAADMALYRAKLGGRNSVSE